MTSKVAGAVARVVVLAFCWTTALYAFIASSPFAYLQFIKPRVFRSIGLFSDWHWLLAWLWLLALVALLRPRLVHPGLTGARTLVTAAGAGVAVNTLTPVVPRLHDGPASVVVGIAWLLPVIVLGLVEHQTAWPVLAAGRPARSEAERRLVDGRIFAAAFGAALLMTGGYAVLTSVSVSQAFEPDLMSAGLALGAAASVVAHLVVFGAVWVATAIACRAGGESLARQYLLVAATFSLAIAALFAGVVGASVGLTGRAGAAAAATAGLSIVAAWGGSRLQAAKAAGLTLTAGLDVYFAPPAAGAPTRRLLAAFAAVLPLAWVCARLAGRIDWDFALLKSGVVIVWVVMFGLVYRAAPLRRVSSALIVVACGAPLAVHAVWHPSPFRQHVLERYAVHNPSFLFADGLLRRRPAGSAFDRYLRANTGLTDIDVPPVPIDLVPSLSPVPEAARPNIFLFVIDSLRADYLSPYNPEVGFTPQIAAFAADSVFFPNAFTRYGGTGLSMPAIWAGSVLPHKQYVEPFVSMNALQKLVDVNGYSRIQTHDHITEALWSGLDRDTVLDRGKTEMDFDFCATVDELGGILERGAARAGPVFAQTRSLNLHVAAVRNGYVPPDRSYPGFEAPYAYRVELIDTCFGTFVERLKRMRLYDNSVIVLTADHGELIGEDGRWGHSYHMFPEVSQVPLFVHLPPARRLMPRDAGAVALSTDITPTIYAALGYDPAPANMLAGHSLFGATEKADENRRRGDVVLAASYGAVYAVVSRNGRRLFIADAIQEQDHAYERRSVADLHWTEVPVTSSVRALGRLRIRRHVDGVSRAYHLDRQF